MRRVEPSADDNQEEKKQEYHVAFQTFERSKLRKLADLQPFSKQTQALEEDRCTSDLLYRLFRNPKAIAPQLLCALIKVIEKKNDPDLKKSCMFRDAAAFLTEHAHADVRIKVFFILVILNKDTDAQIVMRKGYKQNNMWGETAISHFNQFLKRLQELVDNTFCSPFSEVNTPAIVRSFVVRAEQLYLSSY